MPYFTTAELRALPDMSDTTTYSDAKLEAAHDWIASVIERECGTSFVARTRTEKRNGSGTDILLLSAPYVLSITSVTVDETAFTAAEVADLEPASFIDGSLEGYLGVVYRPNGYYWSQGTRNVEITYEAGYTSTPPADIKEAALAAARYHLLAKAPTSSLSDRATSITNEFGNVQLSVAGEDRPTGLPEVDATIMAWAKRVRIPGLA